MTDPLIEDLEAVREAATDAAAAVQHHIDALDYPDVAGEYYSVGRTADGGEVSVRVIPPGTYTTDEIAAILAEQDAAPPIEDTPTPGLPDEAWTALSHYRTDAFNPSDLTDKMKINHRYARELTGLLVTQDLVVGYDGEDGSAWEPTELGLQYLDRRSPRLVNSNQNGKPPATTKETKMATKTKTTKPATTTEPGAVRYCGCGCEEQITGKAQFRQGHDARMVSQLVAHVTTWTGKSKTPAAVPAAFTAEQAAYANGSDDIQARIDATANAVQEYHGEKLGAKFHSAAMNGWDKALSRDTKATAKATPPSDAGKTHTEPGTQVKAKVGRSNVEGHLTAEDDLIYLDKAGAEQMAPKGKYKLLG